jgi:hypothetical protein
LDPFALLSRVILFGNGGRAWLACLREGFHTHTAEQEERERRKGKEQFRLLRKKKREKQIAIEPKAELLFDCPPLYSPRSLFLDTHTMIVTVYYVVIVYKTLLDR